MKFTALAWCAVQPDFAADHRNRAGADCQPKPLPPCARFMGVLGSNTGVPSDHTSALAMLRDWLSIPGSSMLPSERIAAAPTLEQVLTLSAPRTFVPTIAPPSDVVSATSVTLPMNDLQKSLVTGSARRFGMDPAAVLSQMETRQHAIDFFKRRPAR